MEFKTEELRQLQKIELDMLSAFIEVCQKLHLRYYLLGGTLLGAVRHKGFIPWDDDIDVGMPRADYEVFMKEAQAYLPGHLFLQNFHTDPDYPNNFAKIRNCETTFVERSIKDFKINHGAYIDIFPLDYFPENKCKQLWTRFWWKVLHCGIASAFYLPESKKRIFLQIARITVAPFYRSTRNMVLAREKLMTAAASGEYMANYCGAWGQKEIVPAAWYGEGAELEFEGLRVKGPSCYHEWLTQVYGDYMQLPPVEKRVGHHYTEVFDLNKPYTAYVEK